MKPLSYQLSLVLEKVKRCLTYRYLASIEEDLNNVGLAVAKTIGGRLILCKIKNEKPCIDKFLDDYIYLTEDHKLDDSIDDRMINLLIEFIDKSHGEPSKVINKPRSWQHGPLFYNNLSIPEESIERILQDNNGEI